MIYSLFERVWHWMQALTIILLLLTGLEIHTPGSVHLLGFRGAVLLHDVLALFLVANAFLALFYHVATGALRQFIPAPRDFFSLAIAQARYYLRGIFQGATHPAARGGHAKMNVLQQVTYLLILNVVLPLQVVTGVIMWKAAAWQSFVARLGGLHTVATVHSLSAWLLGTFLIGHVYLTTTGPTPWSHLRAMITGKESDVPKPVAPSASAPAQSEAAHE